MKQRSWDTDWEGCLHPPKGLGCSPADSESVHEHLDGSYWFWDETWHSEYGPYSTKTQAEEAASDYGRSL